MDHPSDDLANRRPVWTALATLFLDDDPRATLASRARTLAASPYSLDELEQVFKDEVLPVCGANLASPAGEWAGFDADWLEARILDVVAKPASRAKRLVASWNAPSADWRATLDEVARLRGSQHG
ncbi:hypothetical protein Pla163_08760 [Planctomycetes bacterium Pla163]|uniref:DUF7079 domain-containing protein n=1 Tax=Rohdeia mirabilis TaxID=2528008 RepID=A0A518CX22_9BACT|nr:hypothetical protein Pla163_08760 [Planctomycetes bacterium Pla163]